jgi:excisionase family DNA binding protein
MGYNAFARFATFSSFQGHKKLGRLMKNGWLTTGAIAAYCGVDRSTVLRWIKSGRLTAYTTPGGHRRVRREDFRKFLLAMNLPLDETLFKEASP